ncbi:MAG: hypothetical protein AAF805_06860, partial [Planctomycetota bacterium]
LGVAAAIAAAPAAADAQPAGPVAPASPIVTSEDDLVRVWRCEFDDERWDVNYDAWPDRWSRVYDDEHPQYVRMRIEPLEDASEGSGRRMVIRPDGASARLRSPPIHVMPKFSYKLRFRIRVADSPNTATRVRMAFRSARGKLRELRQTAPIPADGVWRDMELGDFQPSDRDVNHMVIHVDCERGARGDLNAEVSIADLRLYRLPSIKIQTDSRYNVYTDPSDVRVTCTLSGIRKQNPEIHFQLLDATNRSIGDGGRLELNGQVIHVKRTRASDIVDGFGSDKSSYEGAIDWRPPIRDYGFYRVRVGMFSAETGQPIGEGRSISLAVVRPELETSETGEFGWGLPAADRPLEFGQLQELLPRVGVKRVKLPVWFHPGDEERGDALLRFAEQLSARGIDTIGMLEDPTPRIADPLTTAPSPPIQSLLSADPSVWTPRLDHVIAKLALRIRWWQLGADGDTSFVGYDEVVDRLRAIRNQMFRFGQDIRLAIGWRWDHARAWREPLSWDGEQMAGRETLDAEGLDAAMAAAPPAAEQRWVLVEPPPVEEPPFSRDLLEEGEDAETHAWRVREHQRRVRDFVEQIIVAKVRGADGVFVANPFSGSSDPSELRTGVMNDDGTPGELLLPWRTCARLLGGAKHIGSVRMPYGSENWLFRRPDGRVVMVLWNLSAETEEANSTPIDEVLYVGEDATIVDIWGGNATPGRRGFRQVIPVGRMPRFVLGVNEAIARWRMAVAFESRGMASVFGTPTPNSLTFRNNFGQGVGGRVRLVVPTSDDADPALSMHTAEEWSVTPLEHRVSLVAEEEARLPFEVTLREASYGDQLVRVDFDIQADRPYRFSAWRDLSVGTGEIQLDVIARLSDDGRLEIEQRMRKTDGPPADFKCLLYAYNRRRKRSQVFQLGPEVDKKRYLFTSGEDLVGREMRLRIEEVDGRRVLIHNFMVDPVAMESDDQEEGDTAAAAGGGLARVDRRR